MKAPYRMLVTGTALAAAATLGTAQSQDDSDKSKKPQRPPTEEKQADAPKKAPPKSKPAPAPEKKAEAPAPKKKADAPAPEKKADAPKKLAASPPQGRGPQRFGGLGSGEMEKVRQQMRGAFEEIQKLRAAGKDDEAEKKMAEVRKKFEGIREQFAGRGGPPALTQRGPGSGKGGPPSSAGRGPGFGKGGPPAWAGRKPEGDSGDQKRPPARPSAESHRQAAASSDKPDAERKGPPHHGGKGRPEGREHHKGHESRDHDRDGDGDRDHDGDKSRFAQHRKGPGAHPRPPFMGQGRGGPQMMKFRMMQMKRMAMMSQARTFGGRGGFGPGNWGAQRAPFMQRGQWGAQQSPLMNRGPWAAQASPKLRMKQAKKAGDGGGKKRARHGKGRGGEKGASKQECEKCKAAEKKDS